MIINKNICAGLFLTILILGAALRIHNINKYDLWFDELSSDLYSAHQVVNTLKSDPLPVYMTHISHDPHSSLYYFLVYCYSLIFGGGKSLRIISLFFSVLSIIIFYRLSRIFLKRSESLLAVSLMAFSPFHIWYAQEARGYTMVLFFMLLSTYFYMQALRINRLLYWGLFTISSTVAIYSSYYSVFLVVISGMLIFLKDNRRYVKRWFLSILAISLLLLPLALIFIQHYNYVKNSFWLLRPRLEDVFITFAVFNLGYSSGYLGLITGLGLFFSLFVYGAYSFYKTNKEYAIILFLFVFLPIITVYFFSVWYTPVYITRQFLIFTPFYYLLIAKGLGCIKSRIVQVSASIFAILILILSLFNYYSGFMLSSGKQREFYTGIHQKKNYTVLLVDINSRLKSSDIVATTDVQSFAIVNLYYSNVQDFSRAGFRMGYFLFYPLALTNLDNGFLNLKELINTLSEDDKKRLYSMEITTAYLTKNTNLLSQRFSNRLIRRFSPEDIKFQRIWLISSTWGRHGFPSHNYLLVKNSLSGIFKKQISIGKDGILAELYDRDNKIGNFLTPGK